MTLNREDVIRTAIDFMELRDEKEFVIGDKIKVYNGVSQIADRISALRCILYDTISDGLEQVVFAQNIRAYLGNKIRHVVLYNSGQSALQAAIEAVSYRQFGSKKLKVGDEIIVTAVGFPHIVDVLKVRGLVPVFVDVNFPTYTPDVDLLEEAISEKTKAIILSNPFGNPIDYHKVRDLCDEYGLWMIVDQRQGFGSKYKDDFCGTIEDLSIVDFSDENSISVGNGGAVLTNSGVLWQLLEFGEYSIQQSMQNIQAAIGVSQLNHLSGYINERKRNWEDLYDGLKHWEEFIILQKPTKDSAPAWGAFVITRQKNAKFTRDNLTEYLNAAGIETDGFGWGNLVNQVDLSETIYRISNKLYNTTAIEKDTFCVGINPNITEEMVAYMLKTFDEFFERYVK
jgi:CDP-6-deoxy-D-xylo-4-hexulose-3-dehydrase